MALNPSYDGRVYRDDDPGTYNTVHDQASGSFKDDNLSSYSVINRKTGTEVIIVRVGEIFTQTFPTSAVAISGTFTLRATDKNDIDTDSLSVVEDKQASDTAMALADFSQMGDAITNPTKLATDIAFSAITAGNDIVFTLNAAGLAYVNTQIAAGNKIKLALRTSQDCAKTTPTGNNYVTFDGATGTHPPSLAIAVKYSRVPTDSIMNGASRLAVIARGFPRNLTDNILNGAGRLAVLSNSILSTWKNVAKNISSFSNTAKSAVSSIVNKAKNASNWSNRTKN